MPSERDTLVRDINSLKESIRSAWMDMISKSMTAAERADLRMLVARMRAQKQNAIVEPITSVIITVFHKSIARNRLCDVEICFDLGDSLAFVFPTLRHLVPNTSHFQI